MTGKGRKPDPPGKPQKVAADTEQVIGDPLPTAQTIPPPRQRNTPNAWTTCPTCGSVIADRGLHAAAFPDHLPTEGDA